VTFPKCLGRRGSYLLATGIGCVLYGASIRLDPGYAPSHGLAVLQHIAPLSVWALIWIVGGLCAITAAPITTRGKDTFGFIGAVLPPIIWSLSYLAAAWPLKTFSGGWVASVTWGSIAVCTMIAAGWPEDPGEGSSRGPTPDP
jgi:hypothetical protein